MSARMLNEGDVGRLEAQVGDLSEDDLDTALDLLNEVAEHASLWILWKQGRVKLRWDATAQTLRFEGVAR